MKSIVGLGNGSLTGSSDFERHFVHQSSELFLIYIDDTDKYLTSKMAKFTNDTKIIGKVITTQDKEPRSQIKIEASLVAIIRCSNSRRRSISPLSARIQSIVDLL